ncbi:MAG TPA: uroporphyrinogen-III synthase [Rhizomicrobium sp.]|nr:uroporphyrinogen-III synthase [Rhizomicrobium sp.]
MRILVTRPIQDGEEIARRVARMGHETLLAPLLTLRFFDGAPLDLAGIQAVLVTSANGARALARRTAKRDVAIFAVGPQSAQAAEAVGFVRVRNAGGDAAALADAVLGWATPGSGVLLHASGEESGDALCEALAAHGFDARREVLYRMERGVHLPPHAAEAIRRGEIEAALFFSPKSAELFAACVARDGLSTDRMIAICISANTAKALDGLPFAEMRIAATPDQDALLDRVSG